MSPTRLSSIPLITIVFVLWSLRVDAQMAVPKAPPTVCVNARCVNAPSGSVGAGVKWHPGHYALSYQLVYSGNSNWAARKAEIDQSLNQANVLGYMDIHLWPSIENDTAGNYNWANIDQARSYIASNYPGKRYAVMIWSQQFFGTDPSVSIPSYITGNSVFGPSPVGGSSGWWSYGGGGLTAAIWRPAVSARIQALFAALAAHTSPYTTGGPYTYDTDPYFEAVAFQESSISLSSEGDYTFNAYQTQWQNILASMTASFPHTNALDQNNFLGYTGTSQGATANTTRTDALARAAISSPNVHVAKTDWTWGQYAYIGAGNGGTAGFSPLAGKAPYMSLVEGPGDYLSGTQTQLMATAINAATNNGLQSSHVFWNINNNGNGVAGDWGTVVLPSINANPVPGLNRTCPSNYGSCNPL